MSTRILHSLHLVVETFPIIPEMQPLVEKTCQSSRSVYLITHIVFTEPTEPPSILEPASLLEEPSRIEPPSFADSSVMSKTADDSVAPPAPAADPTVEPVVEPLLQRRGSSDDDADNFFDMPDVEQSSPSVHDDEVGYHTKKNRVASWARPLIKPNHR